MQTEARTVISKTHRQDLSASYLSHQGETLTFVSRFRPCQQALSLRLNAGFDQVLVFRDNRGLEGAAFYDAVDLEESQMMTEALKVVPVSLDCERVVHHYQFLNRKDQAILEVLCRRPADYRLLSEED